MAKNIDPTRNTSGPQSRPGPLPYKPGFNESLVDGFIKDGWIDPDLRWQEVCALYQGQAAAESRRKIDQQNREEAKRYAEGWVERVMDYNHEIMHVSA